MDTVDYGQVATALESRASLQTMLLEVEEYFDVGASLSRGAIVLDVGANIGAFAIAAARRCEGEVRLFCFEPVPPLFRALERNLKENRWLASGEHRAFEVALTAPEEAGTRCEFYHFRRLPRDSTMEPRTQASRVRTILRGPGGESAAGHVVARWRREPD